MQLPSKLSGLSPQIFSIKFFSFFLKKPALKNFIIFSQKKNSLYFQESKLSYIFFKKFFLYFGKGIFRTLVHLELGAYLEPWYVQNPRHIQTLSNIYNGMFCKNSYLVHFLAQARKIKVYPPKNSLYFGKWNFLALILKNFLYFLIFWVMELFN